MILVAGLAVAGLAGIAAAFYLSMRPGGSRVRAAGPGRAEDRRPPAGRSRTSQPPPVRSDRSASPARSPRSSRSGGDPAPARSRVDPAPARSGSGRAADRAAPSGSSTVIDFTGPQRVLEDPEPLVTGRRARHGGRQDDTPDEPAPARRAVARRSHDTDPDDAATTSRSRRRVAWRKGSDVDEELWPTETFGGVSDEQFWDDLASDKPLATTARTAQPDTAAKRRPGPLPDLYPGDDRGRGDSRRGAAEGPGTHPQPRLAPDDRTVIQPAATAPVPTQPYPTATQPSPAAQSARAAHQPAEPRGRSRAAISADEDPLTSPAYSLRPKTNADGRSYPSPRRSREQYEGRPDPLRPDGYRSDPLRSDPLRPDPLRPDPVRSGDGYRTGPYPYPQQPYGEPTQTMNTPPYGQSYGYGQPADSWPHGAPASPRSDPRLANGGGWDPGWAGTNGAGDGSWSSRPAYPPVNGHRGPYDPRGNDRRLTSLP
jgi:hypothetical protein